MWVPRVVAREPVTVRGFAPGVIGVGNHRASRSVQDCRHIPLQVGGVVVGGAVVGHGHGNAIGVVGEVQGVAAYGHLAELTAVVDIAIGNRAVGTADSHTVLVIGVGPGGAVLGDGCQLPAMLPGVLPHAIRQGVTPFRIPIGIGDDFQGSGYPMKLSSYGTCLGARRGIPLREIFWFRSV